MTAFENTKNIHDYRTPRALRAFSDVFILVLPILYGPYFAYQATQFSSVFFVIEPLLFALILVGLANIQDDLENPFDQIGVDDVAIDPDRFIASLDLGLQRDPADCEGRLSGKAKIDNPDSTNAAARARGRGGSSVGSSSWSWPSSLVSILWVLAYRFVNPPITFTMIGDMIDGRGANKRWMPISEIDRDMVRAAIAAEDSKFCTHHGFDFEAIEDAMKRNASGGRIRGGSTISQQTAKNAFLWKAVAMSARAWKPGSPSSSSICGASGGSWRSI